MQCCEENAFGDCRRCEQLGNQLPVRAAAHRLIFPIFPSQVVMHAASQLLVLWRAHTRVRAESAIHVGKMRHCLLGQHRDGPALSAMLFHAVPATAFNAVCARASVPYACGASFSCSQPPAGASALLAARETFACVRHVATLLTCVDGQRQHGRHAHLPALFLCTGSSQRSAWLSAPRRLMRLWLLAS